MRELLKDIGQLDPDNLIAGTRYPIDYKGITLEAASGIVEKGTVLGVITASGIAVPVDSTATDGSQNPICVLAETIDTAVLTKAIAYRCGYFFRDALIFGGDDTYETHEIEMQRLGLFMTAAVNTKGEVK